ncbi:MAG: hypothetical protein HRT57_08065 [Crocinitomicaceae bacterium]|nr:hypothetical protein [Crocinitomicaceae bacterium]
MMNYSKIYLFLILFSANSYGQSTAIRDTSLTANNAINVSFTVNTDLTVLEEIELTQYSIISGDTLSVFNAIYNMEDDDPSGFEELNLDEIKNVVQLSTGLFEESELYTVIVISKSSGAPEEIIIN